MNYFMFLAVYVAASVASQFLTSTPLHLFDIGSVPIWLPLSAVTLVPLVDVLRSFTQNQAEKEGRHFKTVASQMMTLTLAVAGLCVIFLGLPLPIFMGVLLAVTFGGLADVLVFKRMGRYFTSPVKRMMFSNAAATLLGSGIVFLVAFTDVVFAGNPLAVPYMNAVVGWLTQSTFIWASSIAIAFGLNRLMHK
ncbi:hypothetical protein [Vibrio parahaemolyticus]|uniref:hypothetical protein n=1 Tax=Vibrio parahaemolyticus TaxID=670 RepID=UPI0030EC0C43